MSSMHSPIFILVVTLLVNNTESTAQKRIYRLKKLWSTILSGEHIKKAITLPFVEKFWYFHSTQMQLLFLMRLFFVTSIKQTGFLSLFYTSDLLQILS